LKYTEEERQRLTSNRFHQFKGWTLDSYKPKNENQRLAKATVKIYLEDFEVHVLEDKIGLTIIGPPGIGKTGLAHAILAEASKKNYLFQAITMANLLRLKQDSFALTKRSELLGKDMDPIDWQRLYKIENKLEAVEKAQILLLDDVGKEYDSGSGWSNSIVDMYIRTRYDHGIGPTLITSNIPIDDWTDKYSASLKSFVHEATLFVNITGEDVRASGGFR
jgi:DNA replication protein DnaC